MHAEFQPLGLVSVRISDSLVTDFVKGEALRCPQLGLSSLPISLESF